MRVNEYIDRYEDELIVAFENQSEFQHFIPFAQSAYDEYMEEALQDELAKGVW